MKMESIRIATTEKEAFFGCTEIKKYWKKRASQVWVKRYSRDTNAVLVDKNE